jgi:hypothetical protein
MMPPALRSRRHSGQALTEFVIIALALVPLFLLMPMIGKYQDLAHATEMASRYVAFDAIANNATSATGFKDPGVLAAEVRRRFFSNADAPIKTGDEAGDFNANRNLMWTDPQGEPLIRKFSDITVSFGPANGANNADGMRAAADRQPFNALPVYETAELMGLQSGIYQANVHVTLGNVEQLLGNYASTYKELGQLSLSMTRSTTLLVNPWTAADSAAIHQRLAHTSIFPGQVFNDPSKAKPVKQAVSVAVDAMEWPDCFPALCSGKGPKLGELSYFDEVVPADRKP